MEKSEKPNYFIMFPSHLMETLNPTDCIMMGLLISLAKRDGYAYPSNKMLEEFFQCSTDKIGRILNNLETGGYIKREIVKDSNNQIVSRKIYPLSALMQIPIRKSADTLSANEELPLSANLGIPYPQKCGDIDIINYNSNKDINIIDSIFNELWDFYGKRGNKKTSHALFQKLSKNDLEAIRKHLPSYVDNHKQNNKLEFLPHLTTYIRQRRWEDSLPYLNTKKDLTKTLINWD